MRTRKSEWFKFDRPLGEPDVKMHSNQYEIERVETPTEVIWFGQNTNWMKKTGEGWHELIMMTFVPCEEPIYETIYKDLYGN